MRTYLGLLVLFAGLAAILSHSSDAFQAELGLTPFNQRIDTVLAETLSGNQVSNTITAHEYLISKRENTPASCLKALAFINNLIDATDTQKVANEEFRRSINGQVESFCHKVK
jgi:hypothetical protein